MNLLTAAAAAGILVFIFQHDRLTGLLPYTSQGGIEEADFLILTAVVFALSTDRRVFLLSRIKEARNAGTNDGKQIDALSPERFLVPSLNGASVDATGGRRRQSQGSTHAYTSGSLRCNDPGERVTQVRCDPTDRSREFRDAHVGRFRIAIADRQPGRH